MQCLEQNLVSYEAFPNSDKIFFVFYTVLCLKYLNKNHPGYTCDGSDISIYILGNYTLKKSDYLWKN